MFMPVRVATRMKMRMRSAYMKLSEAISVTMEPKSGMVALRSNETIASGTVLKYRSPTFVPDVSCLKAMAKTYMITTRRTSVRQTDRMAIDMPFIRTISSGMARRTRTMRATRVSRRSRKTRRMDASPMPDAFPAFEYRRMTVITQVSRIIRQTSVPSKRNHMSLQQSCFLRKARNRMIHSTVKYTQKTFSTKMKMGPEVASVLASLWSASMAIQTALTPISIKVRLSKDELLAICCQ
mmetsp:Transcript_55163/g.124206  ORF Transcript_55163/g.124206 Transcript_55163/m.124206 type:complete len:238 (-) Transcript_55163:724-1437(-)